MDNCEICGKKLTQEEVGAPLCWDRSLCDECATEKAPCCEKCQARILPFSFYALMICGCGSKLYFGNMEWQEVKNETSNLQKL